MGRHSIGLLVLSKHLLVFVSLGGRVCDGTSAEHYWLLFLLMVLWLFNDRHGIIMRFIQIARVLVIIHGVLDQIYAHINHFFPIVRRV